MKNYDEMEKVQVKYELFFKNYSILLKQELGKPDVTWTCSRTTGVNI